MNTWLARPGTTTTRVNRRSRSCGRLRTRSLGTYLKNGPQQVGSAGLVRQVVTVTLSEIEDEVDQVVGRWRSQTSTEQRNDLSYLDDLLGELDDVDTGSAGTTAEMVEELRGRVEILMDEIEISLGIEPPPITGLSDIDADTDNCPPVNVGAVVYLRQVVRAWVFKVLAAIRSTRTGTKSRMGLPANWSCEA